MVLREALEQHAHPFWRSEVLPNLRFEVLPITGGVPAAPVTKPEPCRNHHDVAGILGVPKRFTGDIAGFIQAADAQAAKQFEHAALLPRKHAPFDYHFYCHRLIHIEGAIRSAEVHKRQLVGIERSADHASDGDRVVPAREGFLELAVDVRQCARN